MTASWRRVAVIGASGGIGAALCEALETRGSEVVRYARGAGDDGLRLDLEEEDSIARCAAAAGGEGAFDLVLVASGILSAGSGGPERDWRALDPARLARIFAVNATGPALVAKHFLPLLPRRGRAGFAALSARVGSISDNRLGGWYGYRASKAALNMMVRSLAVELGRKRPDAFAVALHPGTVRTALSEPFLGPAGARDVFTPRESADHLLGVLDGLTPTHTGRLFAWDGSEIAP